MKRPSPTKAKAHMRSDPFMRVTLRISEAALAPDRWPAALQSITEAVGALGMGALLLNKQTGDVEWMSLAGLNLDVKDYIDYYGARDPYRPVLQAVHATLPSAKARVSAARRIVR